LNSTLCLFSYVRFCSIEEGKERKKKNKQISLEGFLAIPRPMNLKYIVAFT
jgi:hypothetical protein